ncbi:srx-54, partial [Pristionchus pacificus]
FVACEILCARIRERSTNVGSITLRTETNNAQRSNETRRIDGDFDFSQHYQYAALILWPIATFGFTSNVMVVLFLRIMPSLNNSFGSLTLSQAVADMCHQGIFCFYFSFCIFLRLDWLYAWSENFGFALIFIYEICGMSHVCISINRFTAVYAPLAYQNIFSMKNTRILISCYWILAAVTTTFMLKMIDCAFLLPQGMWIFIFKDTPTCNLVQWYGDFIKYVAYVAIVATLDCLSILRLHYVNVRHANGAHDATSALRRSRQMNLVYQAALQGIFFISELITYFLLSPYARNKWEAFILTTMSWCLVHGMDGFIVLSCNRDFRRQIKKTLFCKHRSTKTSTLQSARPCVWHAACGCCEARYARLVSGLRPLAIASNAKNE